MSEANKAVAIRWFEEVWNKRRREAIEALLLPDAVLYEGGKETVGPQGFYPFFDRMWSAFSDIHVKIEDAVAEGDAVCLRWTCSMRHTGPGLGMPATGKQLETTGISIVRVANGMLSAGWQNWDMLGLLQQIQEQPRAATYMATNESA